MHFQFFCWSWLLCQVVSNNIIQIYNNIIYYYIFVYFFIFFSSIEVDVVDGGFFVFWGLHCLHWLHWFVMCGFFVGNVMVVWIFFVNFVVEMLMDNRR